MKKFFLFILILLGVAAITFVGFSQLMRSPAMQTAVISRVGEKMGVKENDLNLLESVLGFDRPHTYLLLFMNNTEMRPGGGFIGSYATVKISSARPEIIKVEGTEIIDNFAPQFESNPPDALRTYLDIKKWSFRDSNWSPDFSVSAEKALELYKKENGVAANDIEGVIGVTPTVVEGLLRISGPITVDGEEFTADNFTEKLQYQVEYAFADKGIDFRYRKQMLSDLVKVLMDRSKTDVFVHWSEYARLLGNMLKEKHIVMYSLNPEWQKILEAKSWDGEMQKVNGDYFMLADANLGAWKTDASIERTVNYEIASGDSGYVTTAKLKYEHQGKIDWRTSRYRTYSRIYVPLGSKIIKVAGNYKNALGETGKFDEGQENGRQWFGVFVAVEPGETQELTFTYSLSPENLAQLEKGEYRLFIQKQIGIVAPKLTVKLNFGKNFKTYDYQGDLREDRSFLIKSE